jgi:hypothetical protein
MKSLLKDADFLDLVATFHRYLPKGWYFHVISSAISNQRFDCAKGSDVVVVAPNSSSDEVEIPFNNIRVFIVVKDDKNQSVCSPLNIDSIEDETEDYDSNLTPESLKFISGECALIGEKLYEIQVPLW